MLEEEEDEGGGTVQGLAVLVQYAKKYKNNVRRNLVAIVDLQE